MCELLGMSANVPTDICFSFAGLIQRGGNTGPHSDGWGIAFYQGTGYREFKDAQPSCESQIAQLVKNYPIKSDIVISHIRQANSGGVSLSNTHPYTREMWGQTWCCAHNGQLVDFIGSVKQTSGQTQHFYTPIGETDSEHAFCWLLNEIRNRFPERPKDEKHLWAFMGELCAQLKSYGVFNLLMSDSQYLYCYCSTKLTWITRRAPFGQANLKDEDVSINFAKETTPNDIVTVVSTEALTKNETWQQMKPGEMLVIKGGEGVYQNNFT